MSTNPTAICKNMHFASNVKQREHCFEKAEKIKVKSRDMGRLSQYINYLRSNPKLAYLFVELTDCCNLSCFHCGSSCSQSQGSYIDTGLLMHALETVAEDFPPDSVMVCLTGGEPMLHKDFYKIVEKIVSLGFPWGITTNGTLIHRQSAEMLKKLHLQSITISIDGLEETHDRYRNRPGSFQKTAEAVTALQAAGIPVQITTVVHKGNIHELNNLYELMCGMGIFSWRVINLEPIGRALQYGDLMLSYEEFRSMLDFIREKRYSQGTPMDVRFGCSHYLSYEYEHEVRDNYFICGSGIYVGSILCNGDIYSCLDIERRPELIQGNIANDRFSEVWHGRFQEFRADRTQNSSQCRSCQEKPFCNGDSAHTWNFEKNEPLFCFLRKEAKYE